MWKRSNSIRFILDVKFYDLNWQILTFQFLEHFRALLCYLTALPPLFSPACRNVCHQKVIFDYARHSNIRSLQSNPIISSNFKSQLRSISPFPADCLTKASRLLFLSLFNSWNCFSNYAIDYLYVLLSCEVSQITSNFITLHQKWSESLEGFHFVFIFCIFFVFKIFSLAVTVHSNFLLHGILCFTKRCVRSPFFLRTTSASHVRIITIPSLFFWNFHLWNKAVEWRGLWNSANITETLPPPFFSS